MDMEGGAIGGATRVEGGGIGNKTAKMLYSLSAGRFISVILTLLIFVYVARYLQPSNFGIYTLAFGFATLVVGGFSAFGIGHYFNKNLTQYIDAKDYEKAFKVIYTGYLILFPVALILCLAGILLSFLVAPHGYSFFYILASIATFFFIVKTASENALVGFGKGHLAAIALVVTNLMQFGASVVLIKLAAGNGYLATEGAINGMLVGYFIGFLLGLYYIYASLKKYRGFRIMLPNREELKSAFSFSAPIGLNNMLNGGLNNFSILLIGLYVTSSVLGNYGIALRGLSVIAVFYTAMTMTLIQTFTSVKALKKDTELSLLYNKILRYSLLVTLPIFIFIGVFSKPALFLILTPSYALAPLYLTIIAFGVVINAIGLYLTGLMIANNYTIKTFKYAIVSAFIQLVFLLLLVQNFGVVGGIVAIFIIGGIVDNYLYIKGAKKILNLTLEYKPLLRLYASNIALAVILSLCLVIGNVIIQLLAGLALLLLVYPIFLVLFNAFDKDDLESMRRSVKKIYLIEKPMNLFLDYTAFYLRDK